MFEKPYAEQRSPSIEPRTVDVFLRTCSRHGIIAPGHRINKPRCVSESRELLTLTCVDSLATAIKNSQHRVKLWIIDDHSTEAFLENLGKILKDIDHHLIALEDTGFIASGVEQAALCKSKGRDIVYLTEDDYLHDPNAIDLLVNGLVTLQKSVEFSPIVIYPYDCIDRYKKDFPAPSRVFYLNSMYWRTVTRSTPTVIMTHDTYASLSNVFETMAANYDPYTFGEDQTINRLWNNMVEFAGPAVLFSPIPSLAVHLEHQTPTAITNGLINWKSFWQESVSHVREKFSINGS